MEEEVENEIETKEEKKFNELKIGESMIRIEEEVFGNNDSSKIINLKPSLYDDEIISKTEFKFNESTLSTLIVKNETITTLNEKYTIYIIEVEFSFKGIKKKWYVKRRFNEFKSLDDYIQKTIPKDRKVSTFPSGSYVSNFLSTFDSSFILDRKKKLHEYLQSVVELFPQGLIVFLEFLSSPFSFLFYSDQNLIFKDFLEIKQLKRQLLRSKLLEEQDELYNEKFEIEYQNLLLKGDEFIVFLKSNYYKMLILDSGKTYLISWKNIINPTETQSSKLFYFYLDDVKSISSIPNSFRSDGLESFTIALKTGELFVFSSRYKHEIMSIADTFISKGLKSRELIIQGIQSINQSNSISKLN